ncbi:hypothetical protein ASC68_00890 [Devosia sp. Root105]|nr:hypothetical protein ASC68_00890 [Devosia sp. Root105]
MPVAPSVGQWTGDLSGGTPNSPRSLDFLLLSETIGRLAQLPPSDPLHIDDVTSRYATNLVGLMRSTFDLAPPHIFPQDAEALVMTWEDGGIAKLLTIAGEEVSLLDLHKASQLRCYHEVKDGAEAMPSLIPILLQSSQARSSATED